ncbi:Oidioi.mRNA.OKI2018_I69.PAR.g9407.t1.cds [Oikopleura dioica]|uniref:Oidioi.mRNA.OKI2018_I69.PAR.g9407.t1.cds n=1 Tax=Oikopleura dioica TaxID=34765 RepID=A0ABN7RKD1_OIKDI|nr:Oidioi.mRNA.OKI2018_I69.PAR.g9407.t1.cds [Oikopleura dioica]
MPETKFFTEEQILLLLLLKQTKMDAEQATAALEELERLGPVENDTTTVDSTNQEPERRSPNKNVLDLL